MSDIKVTGTPKKYGDGAIRNTKEGKGRFDLIPFEVFHPLIERSDELYHTVDIIDCSPKKIMDDIANERMIDAIIKMTIYSFSDDTIVWGNDNDEMYSTSVMYFDMYCWKMLKELAVHFQKGAEIYGERNCQKGIPKWSFKDSAMRHATQVFNFETDEPHAISAIWNMWMFAWTEIHEKETTKIVENTVKLLKQRTPEEIKKAKELSEARAVLDEMMTKRKELKKQLLNQPTDSTGYLVKKKEIDDMKKFINTLNSFANELNVPIVTAKQEHYTREEVEAIKKEIRNETIEDYLTKKENIKTIIQAIVEKFGNFGVHAIIGALDEFDLYKGDAFSHEFAKFMETQEGKDRAIWWYSPADMFNQLIGRVSDQLGRHDYHDFVPLLLQLNSAYMKFLNNNGKA